MIAALALATALTTQIDSIAAQSRLAGEVLIARGDTVLLDKAYGTVAPDGGERHRIGARWRLASITKQVTAAILLRDHYDALDAPVPSAPVSLRNLLTHHSGLANADATPAINGGFPTFYRASAPGLAYCLSRPPTPDSAFSYNNCDYIVAAAAFGGIKAWPNGMAMARPGEQGGTGYVAGKPEPVFQLSSFGAAGGLIGSAHAVFAFDRSLMTSQLLSPATLAELWKPEGKGSYQALGQWVFPGQLKGCAKPKRIVQRDGEIGGVQTRNYILPDDDLVVVVFTNRSADDFQFGEIWQGKGFAYDLLSTVACA